MDATCPARMRLIRRVGEDYEAGPAESIEKGEQDAGGSCAIEVGHEIVRHIIVSKREGIVSVMYILLQNRRLTVRRG